jgi:hypothetical protein
VAKHWSDGEGVRRWIAIYPPRPLDMDVAKTMQMWVDHEVQYSTKIAKYRERLAALGWFMKALKEPLTRMANKEDDCKRTFWEVVSSRL